MKFDLKPWKKLIDIISFNHSVNVSWTFIMCQPLFGLWEWFLSSFHSSKGAMPITNRWGGMGVKTLYQELKDRERMHLGIYWDSPPSWDGAWGLVNPLCLYLHKKWWPLQIFKSSTITWLNLSFWKGTLGDYKLKTNIYQVPTMCQAWMFLRIL